MYFPTTSAKVLRPSAASTPHDLPLLPASLADIARLGGAHDEVLLSFARQGDSSWRGNDKTGRSRKLAAVVGGSEIGIWSLRPALLLCKLKRTGTSLRRYGLNKEVHWVDDESSGSCRLLVSTTKSFLFLYSVSLYDASPNAPVYSVPSTGTGAAKGQFVAGSGEGLPLPALVIHEVGYLDFTEFEVTSFCPAPQFLVVATANPPALQTLHYALFTDELHHLEQDDTSELEHIMYLSEQPWIVDPQSPITDIQYNSQLDLYALIAADGRAYAIKNLSSDSSHNHMERRGSEASNTNFPSLPAPLWDGQCFYGSPESDIGLEDSGSTSKILPLAHKATCIAFNVPFSLVAVGLQDGQCVQYSILMPSQALTYSHRFHLRQTLKSTSPHLETGSVRCLTWTSDGYALALGWEQGWAVWTVYGRLTTWAVGGDAGGAEGGEQPASFQDRFMNGIKELFWAPGNFELFALCDPPEHPKERAVDEQLFIIPFAKSAVTSLHTPDNTNHAFLQLDDGLLVYRGADQPDMSVINPESDVWQSIKLPAAYVSNNWPMRYACISADARLIAVAGRRGLVHYNSLSGRWKLFDSGIQEQSFKVQGGMQWYGSTLIVTAEEQDEHDQTVYTLRLFGRDRALNTAYALDEEVLPSRVVLTSLFDSSLLVYTEDNTFYHFLLASTKNGPRLRLCGSIGFEGVVTDPTKVRGLSWMVPPSQQRFGDPSDDLNFATVIFLIEGRLVLLRPRRAIKEEVKYDMQILADRIEFYWTHLTGIGTLENSLWGWDGEQIRVWLNALTIDVNKIADRTSHGELETVEESLAIKIDFYPLSVLMDKGIIVGVEHETCFRRSLDFAIFRLTTNTHLFIHHVLRFHLSRSQTREAVVFASHYQHLVYFAHALEILLHAVLEDEADSLPNSSLHLPPLQTALSISTGPKVPKNAVLPVVVDFLDHFTEALQVVVNCARKTEITRWAYLFQFVGKPRDLFEICMRGRQLKIAASYLLVLHNLEPLEQSSKDTVSLLKAAMAKDDWQLCKELSRFLFSLDHTGAILQSCLSEAGAMPPAYANKMPTIRRAVSMPMGRSNSTPGRTSSPGTGGSSHVTSASTSLSPINSLGASLPSSAAPFARTGTTARAMHYRMSSGSGLGLGTNTRGMTNPHERLRRSLSAQGSSLPGILQESISEKEADDDP